MAEQTPQALLRAAAQSIETALVKLDMKEVGCHNCGTRLFRNRVTARIYKQLSNTPEKLLAAANRLDADDSEPSPGYVNEVTSTT